MAASSEERLKILKLIEENKITPEEGIRLLQALEKITPVAEKKTASAEGMRPRPRWLRVRITDLRSGKVRVNIRLPVTVLSTGMKLGARFSPEIGEVEMGQIMDAIQSGEIGQIVDVYDEEDQEHIEVGLE
ncbi:MAG: SHOCT-like domain-containing protein [Bellilinea sp.]